jgi:methenyltetrahydrofolate cyclohydrolase
LEAPASSSVSDALAALGSPDQTPAAGVACAFTAAAAAGLLELSAGLAAERLAGGEGDQRAAQRQREVSARAAELRERLLACAGEDVAAYERVRGSEGEARDRALSAASDPPLEVAEGAAEVAESARGTADLAAEAGWPFAPDAAAAANLAAAAARTAAELVSANLGEGAGDVRLERARAAVERLGSPG